MYCSGSGRMASRTFLPFTCCILIVVILSTSCSADPEPLKPLPKSDQLSSRKDQAADSGKETLKSQASDSGFGSRTNDYSQQQQQQQYQPPPPPPSPSQSYGPQVQVSEEDYSQNQHQQQPQQQHYDNQQHSQDYGSKGSSGGQDSYDQNAYPAAPAAQQQQHHAAPAPYQPPAPAYPPPQSYPPAQSYPPSQSYSAPQSTGYSSQDSSYNSQSAGQYQQSSYGSNSNSGNSYQAPASSYNNNAAPASQSQYGAPLESTYETPSEYANDSEEDGPYDNSDSGYGTSAPEQHNNKNYQSPPQSYGTKSQGYQVAAGYQQPSSQQQSYPQSPASYAPQSSPYPVQQSQQQHPEQSHSPAPSAAPSKDGYASGQQQANYAPAPAPVNSYPAPSSDYKEPNTYANPSYEQQKVNYGGFRPIQLVTQSAGGYGKTAPKPLVVAILQKPVLTVSSHPIPPPAYQNTQQQHAQQNADHYQLPAGPLYPASENNQYQPQHIPANEYSGPALPLNSYASPNSYQAPAPQSSGSYPPAPNSYTASAPASAAPHPSSSYPPASSYPSTSGEHHSYPPPAYSPGYELATEQEASDDEYTPAHGAEYSAPNYNPSGPGYPDYPKAPVAQPYSNAGFALDYAEGKPYGGRWLQKPYGKKFPKARKPYTPNHEGFDINLPLEYGPPPPPEAPKAKKPLQLAPYASMPLPSVYPDEVSHMPFGVPMRSPSLSFSYRNPALTQSFGSYGVQNHNLRIPASSSYGTLTSDESNVYASTTLAAVPKGKRKKHQRTPVSDVNLAGSSGYSTSDESKYKLMIPSASKLIPNIVKSPIKKIMKAFSKNKLLKTWKRKETVSAPAATVKSDKAKDALTE